MWRSVIAQRMRINQEDCFDDVQSLIEEISTSKLN